MGNFTLPGEAGYEVLTLELAKRWAADVIRDSDGTTLSKEILEAGYEIYSTICLIREHNEWIKEHLHTRQQTFLCTLPKTAAGTSLTFPLMNDFFNEQFKINDSPDAIKFWQVYNRTDDDLVPKNKWRYNAADGSVTVDADPWRQYTVSFLAWRVWEEISMYNHVTNNWNKEHLMQLNPYYPEARSYLKQYIKKWCDNHPETSVVRFTSLFYNFVWIWGSDSRNRHLFTDWSSYDFTVSPAALDDFEKEYGYALTAEDFVQQGKYNAAHRVPSVKKRSWMDFISRFVLEASRELVNIVHAAGKKAYVFYDDCWVGMEPYNGNFKKYGFDGIIKCVFSGYEVRLCANVPADVHEIRFHPYLFPVGLGGAPTFSQGGKPGDDARRYWINARRALLRQKIERCGLGGYLHLVKDYPDFLDAMDDILSEFRQIYALHNAGTPCVLKQKIAILHTWGVLRSWTLSGHFHETSRHILIHVLESLSGLPFDLKFISFEDIIKNSLSDIDVIISAGEAGDAWSGGINWNDSNIVRRMTEWVYNGGTFIGIGEPSAVGGYNTFLRMAHVLGVDIDKGERACHGKWTFDVNQVEGLMPNAALTAQGADIHTREGVFLTDGKAHVLKAIGNVPVLTINDFGKGKGVYIADFAAAGSGAVNSSVNQLLTRFLLNLINYATTGSLEAEGITDNPYIECAVFPDAGKIVFANNSTEIRTASCFWKSKKYSVETEPGKIKILDLQ
ncbi:MAG: 1,3-beta-galactosyl-N-acetylhexosamine phosphorylase [Treponema sp.]|nr:1,3-beta-galactosyl-N-acetylhexosamine phosphorylase [Treponema sp.]